ncbi:extensin [Iris pallida]|uniref:Extensin n=1 Tax=Iris pallida TaxID=29817 RepID=A0AAX6EFR2_IRIPA|nr:extensin [Iris pallida]
MALAAADACGDRDSPAAARRGSAPVRSAEGVSTWMAKEERYVVGGSESGGRGFVGIGAGCAARGCGSVRGSGGSRVHATEGGLGGSSGSAHARHGAADTQFRRCAQDGMRRPRREGQWRRLSARVADPVEAWSGKGFTRLLCPGERR